MLGLCSDDALWHAVTPRTRWSGSLPMRAYLTTILPQSLAEMEGYSLEWERDTPDELVIAKVRCTHGSGLMVYRVSNGESTDIWAMNSKGCDATQPF